MLKLDTADRMAEGAERIVFADPDNAHQLIKVIRPHRPEIYNRFTLGDLTKRHSLAAYLRPMIKEVDEYRRLMFRFGHDPAWVCPVAHLRGYQQTTLGLGMVTERIMGTDGGNAVTLGALVRGNTLTDGHLSDLNAFIARRYAVGVRAGDLSADNFVFGRRSYAGGPTTPNWVLVDGYGDRHAVPIRSLSHWTNALGLDDCFRRMQTKISLTWDGTTRQLVR